MNIEKKSELVYLSLGSNIGNREFIIISAIEYIQQKFIISDLSKLYITSPQEYLNQENFLNCVLSIMLLPDQYSPEELLKCIHNIESMYGRDRKVEIPKGPRSLDIDIIIFGNRIIGTRKLQIPHPLYRKRKFVLLPLLNIAPFLVDPQTSIPIQEYYNTICKDPKQTVYLQESKKYNTICEQIRKTRD